MKTVSQRVYRFAREALAPWRATCANLLRNLNAKGVYIAPTVRYGRNVTIDSNCRLSRDVLVADVAIGKYCYIADGAQVSHARIGNFCSIGPGVRIGVGIHPSRGWFTTHPAFFSASKQCGVSFSSSAKVIERKAVILEADIWIGAGAVILDGLRVGTGAIVGAGAVVTKDVPPYEIWGGGAGKMHKQAV